MIERQTARGRQFNQTGQSFADHRPHRAAQETEIHHAQGHAMPPNAPDARADGILEAGGFLILIQLGGVGGRPGKIQHVHTFHRSVVLLEGAGFDQGVNAFAGGNGEMELAFGTDLEVSCPTPFRRSCWSTSCISVQMPSGISRLRDLSPASLGFLAKVVGVSPGGWATGGSCVSMPRVLRTNDVAFIFNFGT